MGHHPPKEGLLSKTTERGGVVTNPDPDPDLPEGATIETITAVGAGIEISETEKGKPAPHEKSVRREIRVICHRESI